MDNGEAKQQLLNAVGNLRVYESGGRRAPHKPLLVLLALSRLRRGETRLPYEEVKEQLGRLLDAYAPPVKARHQPELPYWHLRSDGLWEVPGADSLERQAGGFPKMAGLRATSGGIREDYAHLLESDPDLFADVVHILLDLHFDEALHREILDEVGLSDIRSASPEIPQDSEQEWVKRLKRDPSFRPRVLRAYEHRCAVSGFQVALKGQIFGVDAAHVMWHSAGGPDVVENGLVLHPTLHLLLDKGAWSLTDDRRVIVSADLTGSDEGVELVRSQHGKPLRQPITKELLSRDYIRWHREPEHGGVFRGPALPL